MCPNDSEKEREEGECVFVQSVQDPSRGGEGEGRRENPKAKAKKVDGEN